MIIAAPFGLVAGVAAGSVDPVFGALGTAVNYGGTSVSSTTSTLTDVAADNLCLAFPARNVQSVCTGVTLGEQSMTRIVGAATSGGYGIEVWACIAASSGASVDVTATYDYAQPNASIITARYSGVSSATALASACNVDGCGAYTSWTTNRTALEITTSERALIIAAGVDILASKTHTAANGYTQRADGSGTPVTSRSFLLEKVADAGNFGGDANFSTAGADEYISVIAAFA
jgi:hypothetical protein